MPKLNWLDTLFFGVRRVLSGGVELPQRPALNFVGASVTDNPAENRIDIALLGWPIRKISPKEVAGHEELITIAAPPGQQVDGETAVQIAGPYCKAPVVSDAAGWLTA